MLIPIYTLKFTDRSSNTLFQILMATSQNSSSQSFRFTASPETNREDTHEAQLSDDEAALAIRMYNLVGPRWDLIAGRIPGRSAEEIKNYWMSRYSTSISTKEEHKVFQF